MNRKLIIHPVYGHFVLVEVEPDKWIYEAPDDYLESPTHYPGAFGDETEEEL